jgi:putative hemolysin
MAAMVGVNALFAGYEIALASVSAARLRTLADANRAGARAALHMKENVEASLAAVQLGITLVGAIAAATGGAGAHERIAPALREGLGVSPGVAVTLAIALVVLPLTFVTIAFGELVPKVFALRNKEWVCLRLSPLMWWFAAAVRPAVWLFEAVARGVVGWHERRWRPGGLLPEAAELQELRALAGVARASRLIGRREEGIILGAAGLAGRPVREIVLPAEHIAMLVADEPAAEALVAAHLDMHTRFPVTERAGDPQAIIGYVTFKDIVAHARPSPGAPSLRDIVRPIPRLADDRPIAECLEELLREHTHIALVQDQAGRVVGMITLEDILEELVGDIQDEYDRLPAHATAAGPGWVAGGGLPLSRLKELTGVDLAADFPADGVRTVSDWVLARLGRGVRGGEVVNGPGLLVTVRKVRRHKVQEAQVARC